MLGGGGSWTSFLNAKTPHCWEERSEACMTGPWPAESVWESPTRSLATPGAWQLEPEYSHVACWFDGACFFTLKERSLQSMCFFPHLCNLHTMGPVLEALANWRNVPALDDSAVAPALSASFPCSCGWGREIRQCCLQSFVCVCSFLRTGVLSLCPIPNRGWQCKWKQKRKKINKSVEVAKGWENNRERQKGGQKKLGVVGREFWQRKKSKW